MKTCTRCSTEKDESEFQIRLASKDGLTAACKKCLSDYDKSRANLPHRVKAREIYQKTDAGKKSILKSKKKWIERNLVKRAANVMVCNAVRDGRLEKSKNCSECGATGRIHGHHDDYAKPLEVRWLCSKCHCAWHKENGEGLNA